MTKFHVKQLILENIRIEENKINWYREGKEICLSYNPGEDTV